MSSVAEIRVFAEQIRLETIKEIATYGVGHIGGSMSVVELMAVLYGSELRHDPTNPSWEDRDRFVMSKGHAGPVVYATLALRGYFPLEELSTLNQNGTRLPSHCDRLKTPGIDMTAGSLGQGASAAAGMAYAGKILGKEFYTYTVLGDGESNEGQVWELALFAPHHKLSRLIAFTDYNKQQLDGATKDILDLGDMGAKYEAFGWHTQVVDGHDIEALLSAIREAKADERPSMIILNTIKGNGFKFAEERFPNHSLSFNMDGIADSLEIVEKRLADAKAKLEEEKGGIN